MVLMRIFGLVLIGVRLQFGLARTDNGYTTFYWVAYVTDDCMRVKRTCFAGEM
jgi:hypothetical protein